MAELKGERKEIYVANTTTPGMASEYFHQKGHSTVLDQHASLVLAGIFLNLKGMNHLGFLSWLEYLFTFVFLVTDIIGLVLLVKGFSEYRRELVNYTQQLASERLTM